MLSRMVRKLREVGLRYAVVLFLARIIPTSFLSIVRIVILHLPTNKAKHDHPIGRWASPDDLAVLTEFGHAKSTLLDRFARGDRAWIEVEADGLVGYCWFTSSPYRDEATGLVFPAHPNEVWLYDAMVHRAKRGRGIYPSLLAGAARALEHEGTHGIRIIVESLNRNSIRAHEAGGATAQQEVRVVTLGGHRRVERLDLA